MGTFIQRVARKILHREFSVNSSRSHLDKFVRRAAESVAPNSLVLDAGAGNGPYSRLFTRMNYETADFGELDAAYAPLTYVCDLQAIPVEADKYDMVLLTQVLEHLPEPLLVLKELNRILKPGHCIWLTQPFYFEEHQQPYDFYRYTQFGLKYLLTEAGFKINEMSWMEGYLGTLSYQLEYASKQLPTNSAAYGGGGIGIAAAASAVFLKPSFQALSFLFSRLDVRHKHVISGHCKNYCVIAEKI